MPTPSETPPRLPSPRRRPPRLPSPPPQPSLAPPDGDVAPEGLGFLLGVAHRTRRRAWEAELTDLGLTAPQAALLRLVVAQPGRGVRRLASELRTDPMNVQRVAVTLIAAGLCEHRRDPDDARRRPLHPTDAGIRRSAALADRARRAEQELFGALGPERYHDLCNGLLALVHHDQDQDRAHDHVQRGRRRQGRARGGVVR